MKLGVEVEGAWSVLMKPGSINIPREFRTNLIRLFKLIKFEMGGGVVEIKILFFIHNVSEVCLLQTW